jgi:hypothetical protein
MKLELAKRDPMRARPQIPGDVMSDFAVYDARADTRLYSVILSRDNIGGTGPPDWRWHISAAGRAAVPKWADLVAIAHELRPGVCFVVGVPPRSWWVNVHPHCLHLFETADKNLLDQWRSERMGHEPT